MMPVLIVDGITEEWTRRFDAQMVDWAFAQSRRLQVMTHRQARRKLGSRNRRRANTNGKILGSAKGSKQKAPCRRNPHPVNRQMAVRVARLVRGAQ